MRLDCLGSGFAFSHGRYWSGFLLDGRVLLDCPPQTLPHLFKLDVRSEAIELVLRGPPREEGGDEGGGGGGGGDDDAVVGAAGRSRIHLVTATVVPS